MLKARKLILSECDVILAESNDSFREYELTIFPDNRPDQFWKIEIDKSDFEAIFDAIKDMEKKSRTARNKGK